MTTELEVVAVECIRGDRRLFSGLGLSLQAGQIQRIEGANGTGKTSLLRIICGLSLPESGEIFWQGATNWPPKNRLLQKPCVYWAQPRH